MMMLYSKHTLSLGYSWVKYFNSVPAFFLFLLLQFNVHLDNSVPCFSSRAWMKKAVPQSRTRANFGHTRLLSSIGKPSLPEPRIPKGRVSENVFLPWAGQRQAEERQESAFLASEPHCSGPFQRRQLEQTHLPSRWLCRQCCTYFKRSCTSGGKDVPNPPQRWALLVGWWPCDPGGGSGTFAKQGIS